MVVRKPAKLRREVRAGKVVYSLPLPNSGVGRTVTHPQWRSKNLSGPLALALLIGAAIGVGVSGWLGYQAIVNPDVVFWLNQYLPLTSPLSTSTDQTQPQTLVTIQSRLQAQGYSLGDRMLLSTHPATDILFPLLSQSEGCEQPCPQAIQELQIYRSLRLPSPLNWLPGEQYFHLLDHQKFSGPEAGAVIGSNLASRTARADSSHTLLFTQLQPLLVKLPTPGSWLNLSGSLNRGSQTIAYGEILYYAPQQSRLQRLLNWSSPQGEPPQWQQRPGASPELVVNQSVGLEPLFQVYELQTLSNDLVQLRPIRLNQPALSIPAFEQSLFLARSGLWSVAFDRLKQVKGQHPNRWSSAAEAQLALIQMHALVTRKQAEQPSVSPLERLPAYWVNGSWKAALQLFTASATYRSEIRTLLQTDSGRLMQRVEATLTNDPMNTEALSWGALTLTAQKGRPDAEAWLRKRISSNSPTFTQIQKLIQSLNAPPSQNNPE